MFKRISLLLTISNGVFTKTRSFNSEHLYSTSHINYSAFDEIILVCTDKKTDSTYFNFVEGLVDEISVPLVISGGISSLEEAKNLFESGADRIIVNRSLWENPEIIKEISNRYGKQSVIASIDFKDKDDMRFSYDWVNKTLRKTLLPTNFSETLPYLGEFFLQDVDRDGRVTGADIDAIIQVCKFLPKSIPIHIGSCGIVEWEQYIELLNLNYIDAVSINNIHHMSAIAVNSLRKECILHNVHIRNHEIL